jgi:hypothetical protein
VTYLPASQLAKWRKENEPSKCPILNRETDDWVVDHDHSSGEVRGVISRQANTLLGKMENIYTSMCKGDPTELPDVLENIASYLRQPDSEILHPVGLNQLTSREILHPVGLNQLTSRFKNNLKRDDQVFLLSTLGSTNAELNACINVTHRVKLFKNLLKKYYDRTKTHTPTCTDSRRAESSQGSDKQIRRVLLSLRRGHTRSSKTSPTKT